MEEKFKPTPESFRPEDVERLKKESERLRELKDHPAGLESKELIKDALKTAFPSPEPESSPVSPAAASNDDNLPDYINSAPPEVKAELSRLIEVSRSHGIDRAIKEAKQQSPFLLDAFHDYLAAAIIAEEVLK